MMGGTAHLLGWIDKLIVQRFSTTETDDTPSDTERTEPITHSTTERTEPITHSTTERPEAITSSSVVTTLATSVGHQQIKTSSPVPRTILTFNETTQTETNNQSTTDNQTSSFLTPCRIISDTNFQVGAVYSNII